MTVRACRFDQVIPAIIEHDAVSNHTFEAQRLLREMGFHSEIFASIIGPGTIGRVRPIDELVDGGPEHWLLYQCSIGSPVADRFGAHSGPKVLDYHNITPAELVERWIPPLGAESRLGRAQLSKLATKVDGSFADSAFNADELTAFGFADPTVVPVLIEAANHEIEPSPAALERLGRTTGSKWLFVGQVAPHKAQHDIVTAFAAYRALFDPTAQLWLVGREMGHGYRSAIERYLKSLGILDAVEMPGSVPAEVLAAYFDAADLFVCLSDHEGFCAPIVEAMARGLPVVGYAVAAVPSTVGGAGVLIDEKDPLLVASVAHELLSDRAARDELVARGRVRAGELSLDAARSAFRSAIARLMSRA
ncbi:MAG TPA: glycosyltransferase [Acidimicrobiales bacterium]|jgi:glycosyltransferase involved in cell wall biosynthesis|nr:glycosyltransferase [Acidimicrobiales bacterium]